MTTGTATGSLLVGLALGAVVALWMYIGMSYTPSAQSSGRVSRKDDPFSFWTQIGPIAAAALFFIAVGLYGLIHG